MSAELAAAGISLIGGLLSGPPKLPREVQRLYNLQHRAGRRLEAYSKSVPMSDPLERAALASQRALLGQQQALSRDTLFANLGAMGSPAPADMLMNLSNQFGAQQSALTGQHILNALNQRRGALMQAAQVAQGAQGGLQYQPGVDLGGIMAQLAQTWAFQNALKRGADQQQATPGGRRTFTTPYGGYGTMGTR